MWKVAYDDGEIAHDVSKDIKELREKKINGQENYTV